MSTLETTSKQLKITIFFIAILRRVNLGYLLRRRGRDQVGVNYSSPVVVVYSLTVPVPGVPPLFATKRTLPDNANLSGPLNRVMKPGLSTAPVVSLCVLIVLLESKT
jgi:hypothetical protein